MVTMKAKQMVSKFDLDVLKQPLTFNIIITIIPVGRVMYIYTALTGVDRWIGNWEDWTSCSLAHWMLPVSQQKAVCGKFPAHLMMRSDGRTADSGDLFVSMNGLVVYLMFLFCVVWLTKDFTLSQENVKLCLKHCHCLVRRVCSLCTWRCLGPLRSGAFFGCCKTWLGR